MKEHTAVAECDIIFAGGRVVDGTGSPPFRADVGVAEGRIQEMGRLAAAPARRQISIAGLLLSPGFVDMHSHSDLQLLAFPQAEAKVMQGVTTEVIGQDGLSFAPVDARTMEAVRERTVAWNGVHDCITWDWSSVAEYLEQFDGRTSPNTAYLVPHGTVRILVMGDEDRAPKPHELAEMRRHVRQGILEGAVGLSTGLSYPPAMFADTDELVELCEELVPFGGYFAPHHRSYGKGALDSYAEMVEVARRARVPLHLTHCVMNFAGNEGRARELVAMINALDPEEIELTADAYPYTAGSTSLASLLPPWTSLGGAEATLAALADDGQAARIRREMEEEGTPGYHFLPVAWDTVVVSAVETEDNQRWVGRRIPEIAAAQGIESFEAARRLLLQERLNVNVVLDVGHEDNLRTIIQQPWHMGGTDGIMTGAKPHPRSWGTFPRFLGNYARDERMFRVEEIVRKMTSLPCRRLGQWDRGLIRPGLWADLVVFDPEAVRDTATYANPKCFPEGIPYVMVNGTLVKDEGMHTGARPGRVLRLEVRR
jgi:N-acyl-D-amino-acid deacylase